MKDRLCALVGLIAALPFLVFYMIAGEKPNEEYATNQNDELEDQTNEM